MYRQGVMITSKINPLAVPKGTRKLCELCQKPARLQCAQCRVTFYCDPDHQAADWGGIHQEVCLRLALLRGPPPPLVRQADRDAHRAQTRLRLARTGPQTRLRLEELLGVCQEVARGRLAEGRPQEALPSLQLALGCGLEVHGGPGALPLVPLYLMLGRAYMGLGRLGRAREYLSKAEWAVLQTPGCERALLHQLHRALGSLHAATGDLDAALFHLATDVYYATEEFGLDSPVPCAGYFLMAELFERQGRKPVARSLYSQVASTWHSHLSQLCEPYISSGTAPKQSPFDHSQLIETDAMLRSILAFGEKEEEEEEEGEEEGVPASERGHQVVMSGHGLAMLWFLAGDAQQVRELCYVALQGAQHSPDSSWARSIQGLLQLVGTDPEPKHTQDPQGPPDPDPLHQPAAGGHH